MFNQLGQAPGAGPAISGPVVDVPSDVYLMPIERLDLSSRTLNCLKRAKLDRVGQVLELNDDDLLNIRNFGQKSLEELQGKLAELGAVSSSRREALAATATAGGGGYELRPEPAGVFDPDGDYEYGYGYEYDYDNGD